MTKPYICTYCHLATKTYHEGPEDCQEAMRALVPILKKLLISVIPFSSCWEFDAFDLNVNGEELHTQLTNALGITKEELLCLVDAKGTNQTQRAK